MKFLFSAVQCRLECDSGYVSDLTPVFECTGGRYQPATPNMFFCKPAVAMIISGVGEREILSTGTKCDQMLSSIPNKNMIGHSVNLLDNELILGATTVDNEKSWRFMSLNNPRAGLLTNQLAWYFDSESSRRNCAVIFAWLCLSLYNPYPHRPSLLN